MEEVIIQINGEIMKNVDVSVKNVMCVKMIMHGILVHVTGKYLASAMDDSAIICDETIEQTVQTNFNENKETWKTQNFFILFAFF